MSSLIDRLATSLGVRSEVPNVELANAISETADEEAFAELIELLQRSAKPIRSDCIKVIYEVAERRPDLVSPYFDELVHELESKDNRIVWGAMTAIDRITSLDPDRTYAALRKLREAADRGSVITRDHFVGVLIKLCGVARFSDEAFGLLISQLKTCPTNQLPMYAEQSLPAVAAARLEEFIDVLVSRAGEIDRDSGRKRIERVAARARRQTAAKS